MKFHERAEEASVSPQRARESGRKLDRAQTFPKIRQSELRDNVALEL